MKSLIFQNTVISYSFQPKWLLVFPLLKGRVDLSQTFTKHLIKTRKSTARCFRQIVQRFRYRKKDLNLRKASLFYDQMWRPLGQNSNKTLGEMPRQDKA